jgi:hypothetical protein
MQQCIFLVGMLRLGICVLSHKLLQLNLFWAGKKQYWMREKCADTDAEMPEKARSQPYPKDPSLWCHSAQKRLQCKV